MPAYGATLLASEEVARGTLAFRFARPEGFSFRAGQAVRIRLVDPPQTDDKGDSRTFSLASAPSDDTLQVATRMRDTAFKRVLRSLERGAVVGMRGPMGDFTLPDDPARPVVLLAGGIGVTPFMSMLREEDRRGSRRPRVLICANRSAPDAPFLDELQRLAQHGTGSRLVSVLTEAPPAPGTRGGIADPALLARELHGLDDAAYYLAGPPGMVGALRTALAAFGAPSASIRTDEFYGY